jgi:hypothetical protein
MAATRKSAKRGASKKRVPAKKKGSGKTSVKSSRSKAKSKKTGRSRATTLAKRAKKSLGAARDGFDSVLEAGGKTWRTLKDTTALMMDGVKETLASEPQSGPRRTRRR